MACPDDLKCDAHGYLHYRRQPTWQDSTKATLDGTKNCCQFLVAMAAEIAVTYSDIQERFNPHNCQNGRDICYPGLNYQCNYQGTSPEPIFKHVDTTCLLADIVAACRERKLKDDEVNMVLPIGIGLKGGSSGAQSCPGPEVLIGPGIFGGNCIIRLLQALGGAGAGGAAGAIPLVPKIAA